MNKLIALAVYPASVALRMWGAWYEATEDLISTLLEES